MMRVAIRKVGNGWGLNFGNYQPTNRHKTFAQALRAARHAIRMDALRIAEESLRDEPDAYVGIAAGWLSGVTPGDLMHNLKTWARARGWYVDIVFEPDELDRLTCYFRVSGYVRGYRAADGRLSISGGFDAADGDSVRLEAIRD